MLKTENSKEPFIRVGRPGDEAGIHESHMRSIREICVKDHGEEEIKGWGYRPLGTRWDEPLKTGHVWVIELDKVIQGSCYIRIFEEDAVPKAHIHCLYITPEVLGKGLGLKLARLMIAKAKESGAKSVTLESTITAHEFYKKLGFSDTGPIAQSIIGGYPVSNYPMVLNIS
jgi:GNAT superfamily N-acetyltransferase